LEKNNWEVWNGQKWEMQTSLVFTKGDNGEITIQGAKIEVANGETLDCTYNENSVEDGSSAPLIFKIKRNEADTTEYYGQAISKNGLTK